jgi:secernin
MCDTIVSVRPGSILFAKNSDRDANEAQLLDWQPRRSHPAGTALRCTWIEIPEVRETHAVLLSRPFWMWGAEMGTNEHGVTIGNEAVFTREPYAKTGLTGMDLLRLALERAETARGAVEVITRLLEQHGQGGGCGLESKKFTYHNSYLVADGRAAWLLETAGKLWVAEPVSGVRSISNALSVEPFASRHRRRLYDLVGRAHLRRARTESCASGAQGVGEMLRLLRDHGPERPWPRYSWVNGFMEGPCMHGGGLVTSSQTAASWVAELGPSSARHWVTATAAPCLSLFKPVDVGRPLGEEILGPPATDLPDDRSLWWRHERLHRTVLRDPERLAPLFLAERDEVQRAWLAAPPEPAAAFAEETRLLGEWTARVLAVPTPDRRPCVARRYWRRRTDERWRCRLR